MRGLSESEQEGSDQSPFDDLDDGKQSCIGSDARDVSARRKIERYWEDKRLRELLGEF